MTPAIAPGIAQTLPQISPVKYNVSTRQQSIAVTPRPVAAKDTKESTAADSINISQQARQAITNVTKNDAENVSIDKEIDTNEILNSAPEAGKAKVQFMYDLKGDLITKFKDSSERIIYQIPSELNLRLAEFSSIDDSSVNTKV